MTKQVSKYISYKEATYSTTADRLGFSNDPDEDTLSRMVHVATEVFDKVRAWADEPILVTSFFRGKQLNKAIGGSVTSQHYTGNAIDFQKTANGKKTNAELFEYIAKNLDFDQLIWEHGDDNEPKWVHVSYKKQGNRKQILRAYKVGNKTLYEAMKI